MIISEKHKYVYIGIPRTGSKSMNHWLREHFDGSLYGAHHGCLVPAEVADYLIFTVVRNPYERRASHHFAMHWAEQGVQEAELGRCRSLPERLQRSREILKARERQRQGQSPQQSGVPLQARMLAAMLKNESWGEEMNQNRYIQRAKIKLALYFERLPQCLLDLPFVDPSRCPPFPHHPERGIRPKGSFFDLFSGTDEEQVVWAHAAEDFEALDYCRFEAALPPGAPNSRWIA